ncbi:MAG: hypothetical protein HY319_28380 [Armatimonadetes bacterium]|nr:hypothetical protein [Armatimonadota bacterium]
MVEPTLTEEIALLEEAAALSEQGPAQDEEFQELVYRPLELLKDVSRRLLRRSIPSSRERLDGLFSHVSGAVDDLLCFAERQVEEGLEEIRRATVELALDTEADGTALAAMTREFRESKRIIFAGLERARTTFFSASSLEELGEQQGALQWAESELEEGLARLESVLTMVGTPALLEGVPAAPEAPLALEALAGAVEALGDHLKDGDTRSLEEGLRRIEEARNLVSRALERASGEG